jgi:hypothetical protein
MGALGGRRCPVLPMRSSQAVVPSPGVSWPPPAGAPPGLPLAWPPPRLARSPAIFTGGCTSPRPSLHLGVARRVEMGDPAGERCVGKGTTTLPAAPRLWGSSDWA